LDWGESGGAAFRMRREEDHAACAVLGAQPRHFDWIDAIYRREAQSGDWFVNDDKELFGNTPEPPLVDEIAAILNDMLPEGSQVVLPMGLGGHVDHQAVVQAGKRLDYHKDYYADYPYIIKNFDDPRLCDGQLQKMPHTFTETALRAWQEAVLCYTSQLSTFWRDEPETRLALRNYLAGGGGRLWEKSLDRMPPQR
jgi:LmbE family N-acetylglucosaminyl deacetylase